MPGLFSQNVRETGLARRQSGRARAGEFFAQEADSEVCRDGAQRDDQWPDANAQRGVDAGQADGAVLQGILQAVEEASLHSSSG